LTGRNGIVLEPAGAAAAPSVWARTAAGRSAHAPASKTTVNPILIAALPRCQPLHDD
jgi:hypothetical protein